METPTPEEVQQAARNMSARGRGETVAPEDLLDEEPNAPSGKIPAPQMRMFAQQVQTAKMEVPGIGPCILQSFTCNGTVIDVFYPVSAGGQVGADIVKASTGVILADKLPNRAQRRAK